MDVQTQKARGRWKLHRVLGRRPRLAHLPRAGRRREPVARLLCLRAGDVGHRPHRNDASRAAFCGHCHLQDGERASRLPVRRFQKSVPAGLERPPQRLGHVPAQCHSGLSFAHNPDRNRSSPRSPYPTATRGGPDANRDRTPPQRRAVGRRRKGGLLDARGPQNAVPAGVLSAGALAQWRHSGPSDRVLHAGGAER